MKYVALLLVFSLSLCAEVFKVYTEQNPPYNFVDNGKIAGHATKLVEKLFAQCGHKMADDSVHLLPWARGYHEVLHENNTMLYSMIRTPEREALFQWVGPVGKMTLALIAKKSTHLSVATPAMLHRYKIATIPDTASEKALLALGFQPSELERFANALSQLKKLKENRIDAIAFSVEGAFSLLKEMGCDVSEYEVVYVLQESDLYFAFHKDTSLKLIAHMNETLKNLTR